MPKAQQGGGQERVGREDQGGKKKGGESGKEVPQEIPRVEEV